MSHYTMLSKYGNWVTCLHGKKNGDRNVDKVKIEWLLEIIAARVIRKRKIEEVVRSFALRACRRSDSADSDWAIDCQQGEAKRSWRGSVTVHCSFFSFVWRSRCFYACFCIACYCFSCNNLLKLMLRCWIWIILGVEMVHFQQVL